MPSTRILVTGGTGFLGSEIVSALVTAKVFSITALDLNPPSLNTPSYPSVSYVRCDILNPSALSSLFKAARPEIIVHTAAVNLLGAKRYGTEKRGKEEGAVMRVNVDGTRNVLEAARACGAKGVVYTSSVTVLVDELEGDFRNADEGWGIGRAGTVYGESKTIAEQLVLASNEGGYKTCALRAAPIFGPRDPITIPTIHSCIAHGETPFILGTGTNLQDYVYVANVADAHVLAIHNLLGPGTAAGEAFFITNGEPVTVRDLCLAVWKEFDHFPRFELRIPERMAWWVGWGVEWVSWATGRKATFCRGIVWDATKARYVSIEKARRVLGYEPRVRLPEALAISCQYFKRQFSEQAKR
ncbi:C-3 sterol dehydrogenase/C-4 decarboxylase family protein [Bimuria novae-zelandiae CBS 107.79]|uniref:C-3 sterol dehydrogenase/C-4 decarboxylase family protein n=1 Tax=Bimuria novae-zelandiae CBS 107.79 TaxID=1447943 RepID=A0A6A5UXF4_9PLEO|nr:C-3 sterol dehydrogenase/C-4 decarboxylase family protein [Bimuria novae-zelandiae CBS 107.79]